MKAHLNDREVDIQDIEHGEDYCDSYIIAAQYVDTGEDLTEDELQELTELCMDILYEEWYERRACSAYDRAKDAAKYGD